MVDASVLIDYFNGRATSQTDAFDEALSLRTLLVGDLVRFEVLCGFRTDRARATALKILDIFPTVSLGGEARADLAADRYRFLRRRGITTRKSIDLLLASYCIDEELPLLFEDRDFLPYIEHFGLRRV